MDTLRCRETTTTTAELLLQRRTLLSKNLIPNKVIFVTQYLIFMYASISKMTNKENSQTLLLGHWYEIMALYYVKSILTEISASRQDRRVLQKSKIIRIEFLSKWGMLQTSRYV